MFEMLNCIMKYFYITCILKKKIFINFLKKNLDCFRNNWSTPSNLYTEVLNYAEQYISQQTTSSSSPLSSPNGIVLMIYFLFKYIKNVFRFQNKYKFHQLR